MEWHIRPYAHWCIFLALAVWFWAWGVARGILRVTAAGVVGAWYFADEENVCVLPLPTPSLLYN